MVEVAEDKEAPEASVEEEDLAEDGEARGPGGLEPAKVDGEAEGDEDEEVGPGAVPLGIDTVRVMKQKGDGHRREEIDEKPEEVEGVGVETDEDVGN